LVLQTVKNLTVAACHGSIKICSHLHVPCCILFHLHASLTSVMTKYKYHICWEYTQIIILHKLFLWWLNFITVIESFHKVSFNQNYSFQNHEDCIKAWPGVYFWILGVNSGNSVNSNHMTKTYGLPQRWISMHLTREHVITPSLLALISLYFYKLI
jgi:hypothetical protein